MTDEHNKIPETITQIGWKVDPQGGKIFGEAVVSKEDALHNVQVADKNSMLNWEVEKDPMPEIKITHTPEDELLKVLTPVYQKAEEQLIKLKGVAGSEDLYNRYKRVVDYSYGWKAYADQQRQKDEEAKQMEAEAQRMILEAEALLYSPTNNMDIEEAYEKVKTIVNKLGSRASIQIQTRLQELKKAVDAATSKKETN